MAGGSSERSIETDTAVPVDVRRLKQAGVVVIAASLVQIAGAFLPDQRVFMSSDPAEQLEAIAGRQWGWDAQSAMFTLAFAALPVGFGLFRSAARTRWGRRLAGAAAATASAAALLWLPQVVVRVQLSLDLDDLLAAADPQFEINTWAFPFFTVASLAAALTAGLAMRSEGQAPKTGAVTAVAAAAGLGVYAIAGDWPPVGSQAITLAQGVAILFAARRAIDEGMV